jgi:hypothetical protein
VGRVDELQAAGLELLVGGLAVVGVEEDRSGGPLRHQGAHLIGGLVVEHGRARDGHQRDRDVGLPDRADREPAEVTQLRHGHVGADLHAERLGVEVERLVLVVHPQLSNGDPDHRSLLKSRLTGRQAS